MTNILWSSGIQERFRPELREVLVHYTHPFPSRDGNKRSYIATTAPKRIPQNGVAPFRMEEQTEIELDFSGMSPDAITAFIGTLVIDNFEAIKSAGLIKLF